ncbi:MAG: FAD-dependent oxidoreductase [Chitinivibrionales bacterium]|nr:FAD-dependent oxidoreductase [Chitinivibrionales bacterium]
MQNYKYLIIGGGMTAAAAAAGIREVDTAGGIGLLSEEPDAPYNRPPLSKKLWKGKPLETIWRKMEGAQVDLRLGRRAVEIMPGKKRVKDDTGETFSYEKLLVATGGAPRRLPLRAGDIIYFRTLADYRRLRAAADSVRRFAVIGGGFIGSEIAAALAMNGKEVVMVFPGNDIGDRIFPGTLSRHLSEYYRKKGVEVIAGEKITGLEIRNNQRILKTGGGREIVVDEVVAGIGLEPAVELARSSGIAVDDGIVVSELLQTNLPDIFAAGDVAQFYNPALGKRIRVEHEDNANTMGRLAGRNMAGMSEPYTHLPYFYSDLFDLGYEAVGELDSRLETFIDWKRPFEEGVVYYLKAGRVRGVLLWNVWEQVDAARALIADPGPFTLNDLKGRLPAAKK